LTERSPTLRFAFIAAVIVKGIDGAIESVAGAIVALAGTQSLYALLIRVTAPELELHPQSHAVHLIRHGAQGLVHASSRFVAIWLLVHGILKLALAVELLRGRRWIFPVASGVLACFVGYMAYRLTGHWSTWLLAFALFDVMTIALVLNEWRSQLAGIKAS
jgi:uncharacterized membrane protein